jgi:FKBP-type peptidyl-prolyl cis-trans isomerase
MNVQGRNPGLNFSASIATVFFAASMALLIAAGTLPVFGASGAPQRGRTNRRAPARSRVVRPSARPVNTPAGVTTPSGLTYLITHHGTGIQPKPGDTVVVHYTGTLLNGVKFDSSRDRGEPIAFQLGAGRVIKGWDEGIALMHVGDQAILVIPPQIAYGPRGAGNGVIPPDATLIFVVELADVKTSSLSGALSPVLQEKGIEAMVARYHELTSRGTGNIYSSESDLNGWGYRLFHEKRYKEAIAVFKLNVEAYPRSANVYDSLAKAYMSSGDNQSAIENYKTALMLRVRYRRYER